MEIERKYLIKMPNVQDVCKKYCVTIKNITQTYLMCDKGEKRVRQIELKDGSQIYYLTEKEEVTGLIRIENEREISKQEYLQYLLGKDENFSPIVKTRYVFEYKNQCIELDIYPFWSDKAIVEVELESQEQKINLPIDFEIIKEVTYDKHYKNNYLAKIINP